MRTDGNAIHREKGITKRPRGWKLNLIEALNPLWLDLYQRLNNQRPTPQAAPSHGRSQADAGPRPVGALS
jgi:hypothetical protein